MPDTFASSLIAQARDEFSPTVEQVERLRLRLAGPGGPGGPDDGGGVHELGAGAGTVRGAFWRWGAVGGIVALFAGVAGVAATRRSSPEASTEPAVETELRAPSLEPPRAREMTHVEAPALEVADPERAPSAAIRRSPAASASASAPASMTKRARSERARAPVSPGEEEDELSAELELLVRAREALRDESWSQVEAAAQQHAKRFPDGSFGDEFEALDTMARCAISSPETAAILGRHHLESGHVMFHDRVSRACGL